MTPAPEQPTPDQLQSQTAAPRTKRMFRIGLLFGALPLFLMLGLGILGQHNWTQQWGYMFPSIGLCLGLAFPMGAVLYIVAKGSKAERLAHPYCRRCGFDLVPGPDGRVKGPCPQCRLESPVLYTDARPPANPGNVRQKDGSPGPQP